MGKLNQIRKAIEAGRNGTRFERVARDGEALGERAARRFARRYSPEGEARSYLDRKALDAQLTDAISARNRVMDQFVPEWNKLTDREKILHPHAIDDIRENYLKEMGYIKPGDNSIRTIDDLDNFARTKWGERHYDTQDMEVPAWEDVINGYMVDPVVEGWRKIKKEPEIRNLPDVIGPGRSEGRIENLPYELKRGENLDDVYQEF